MIDKIYFFVRIVLYIRENSSRSAVYQSYYNNIVLNLMIIRFLSEKKKRINKL